MINDNEIKATKSPFAMRPNEEKVFDGKTGYSSINQAVFMVDMGYVHELHFEMLELISKFEFITSRQIYQLLQLKGVEIKDQNKVNARLENLIKAINELKEKGVTFVIVSHSMAQVKSLCQKAIWIENSKVMGYGEVNEIVDKYTKYCDSLKH